MKRLLLILLTVLFSSGCGVSNSNQQESMQGKWVSTSTDYEYYLTIDRSTFTTYIATWYPDGKSCYNDIDTIEVVYQDGKIYTYFYEGKKHKMKIWIKDVLLHLNNEEEDVLIFEGTDKIDKTPCR